MPLLNCRGETLAESFERSPEGDPGVGVPALADWDGRATAAWIRGDADAQGLPDVQRLQWLLVQMSDFVDGRAFSLARQLRRRGFGGSLVAVGVLLPDQVPELAACGYDAFELPAERLAAGRAALECIRVDYRSGLLPPLEEQS